jgi:hypothetical protein
MAAMNFIDDIHAVLVMDDELISILPGGVYSGSAVREISRQNTPAAFDVNMKIMPCALVVANTDLKSGPYSRSIITTLSVYFYQLTGYDVIEQAMARVFDLLHEQRIGNQIWTIEFSNSVENQNDIALDCSLATQRYAATRMRARYEPSGS